MAKQDFENLIYWTKEHQTEEMPMSARLKPDYLKLSQRL